LTVVAFATVGTPLLSRSCLSATPHGVVAADCDVIVVAVDCAVVVVDNIGMNTSVRADPALYPRPCEPSDSKRKRKRQQYHRYNCTEIRAALNGIDVLEPVFHKLAAMTLVEYDRVLVLDFDVTVRARVTLC